MVIATVLDVRNKLHHFHIEWGTCSATSIEISMGRMKIQLPALVEVYDRMWIVEMKPHPWKNWDHVGDPLIRPTARLL